MATKKTVTLPELPANLLERYELVIEVVSSLSDNNGSTWRLSRKLVPAGKVFASRTRDRHWSGVIPRLVETVYDKEGSVCDSSVASPRPGWGLSLNRDKGRWGISYWNSPLFDISALPDSISETPEGDYKSTEIYPDGLFSVEKKCPGETGQLMVKNEISISVKRID